MMRLRVLCMDTPEYYVRASSHGTSGRAGEERAASVYPDADANTGTRWMNRQEWSSDGPARHGPAHP